MLKFGIKLFKEGKLSDVYSYKQNFLLLSFGCIHNYSEAIYKLCFNSRPHAATVLLRSIIETHFNINYILNINSNKRLTEFICNDNQKRIKIINEFVEFTNKYPNWENKYLLTDKKNLTDILTKLKKDKDDLGSHFKKIDKWPDLKNIVIKCDKKITSKSSNKGDMEFNYHLIYRYFSNYVHLTPSGMDNFLLKKNGNIELILGQAQNVNPIVITIYGIYLSLLNHLKKWKLIDKKISLKKYNTIAKKIVKSLNKY